MEIYCAVETENNLMDNGYEHITVAREITTPDLDLLRYVAKIVPGNNEGDRILLLTITNQLLLRFTRQTNSCVG